MYVTANDAKSGSKIPIGFWSNIVRAKIMDEMRRGSGIPIGFWSNIVQAANDG
jgi:hypothetical protein